MGHEQPQWNLREGLTVVGADGGKVGQIVGVQATFFVVEKGWFFPTDYYIPVDAIAGVDAEKVHLNLPREEALHQGWDVLPAAEAEALKMDATAVGTTLGGYTATMGKMEAEIDVSAAEVAAALDPVPVAEPAPAAPSETEVPSISSAAGPVVTGDTPAPSPSPDDLAPAPAPEDREQAAPAAPAAPDTAARHESSE